MPFELPSFKSIQQFQWVFVPFECQVSNPSNNFNGMVKLTSWTQCFYEQWNQDGEPLAPNLCVRIPLDELLYQHSFQLLLPTIQIVLVCFLFVSHQALYHKFKDIACSKYGWLLVKLVQSFMGSSLTPFSFSTSWEMGLRNLQFVADLYLNVQNLQFPQVWQHHKPIWISYILPFTSLHGKRHSWHLTFSNSHLIFHAK